MKLSLICTEQDFLPKLKKHLLPRLKGLLTASTVTDTGLRSLPGASELLFPNLPDMDQILFKHDRLYCHNIMRINYTTYDIRRAQDTVNPTTSRRDVMVLSGNQDASDEPHHPFMYARVLGIYHVNALYVGPGRVDFNTRRLEFLWVRWYDVDNPGSWDSCSLDCISLRPLEHPDAFGFLDPELILRGSHIIGCLAKGPRFPSGHGLSICARDSQDWKSYYVDR